MQIATYLRQLTGQRPSEKDTTAIAHGTGDILYNLLTDNHISVSILRTSEFKDNKTVLDLKVWLMPIVGQPPKMVKLQLAASNDKLPESLRAFMQGKPLSAPALEYLAEHIGHANFYDNVILDNA